VPNGLDVAESPQFSKLAAERRAFVAVIVERRVERVYLIASQRRTARAQGIFGPIAVRLHILIVLLDEQVPVRVDLIQGREPNNLPLIADTLAVRATIFTDHHGGYISNVSGTIQLPPALCPAGATCPAASNGPFVGSNQNSLNYQG